MGQFVSACSRCRSGVGLLNSHPTRTWTPEAGGGGGGVVFASVFGAIHGVRHGENSWFLVMRFQTRSCSCFGFASISCKAKEEGRRE